MLSYWEKKNLLQYDLVVIGAGFVGLSTAIHYKEKFPRRSVLVLERGVFPSGASTRNAGFACFGSLTEIHDDLIHNSEKEVFELVLKRRLGLKQIRKTFGDVPLGYVPTGGFDLIREQDEYILGGVDHLNRLLKPLFGEEVFEMSSPSKFGFSHQISHLVKNRFEGQLDPAKYLKCLWQKCMSLQVNILTGAEVNQVDKESCEVYVRSYYDEEITFKGRLLAICTNAFARQLVEDIDLIPGRGMIMLSKPLAPFPWQGTFHMDRGFVYFRDVDNRLLIGGGRNIEEKAEATTERGINAHIRSYLEDLVNKTIFPSRYLDWDMEWSGTMAFGASKKPIIQNVNPRVALGVRLGGMGVAIGWETGQELAELLAS